MPKDPKPMRRIRRRLRLWASLARKRLKGVEHGGGKEGALPHDRNSLAVGDILERPGVIGERLGPQIARDAWCCPASTLSNPASARLLATLDQPAVQLNTAQMSS
jgi:hypothetical protein